MAFLINCGIKDVLLEQIDQRNDCFKISKPHIDEKLKHSILTFGLLDPPVLLKGKLFKSKLFKSKLFKSKLFCNSAYQIISGHNRICILKELNYTAAPAFVLNELKPEDFVDYALLKNYRQEIGAIGKIKFIRILKNIFQLDEKDISIASKRIQIPGDMIHADLPDKLLSLPEQLKYYLDIKDIGFKVIKNIIQLPDDAILLISKWTADISIRVNLFKPIIDHMADIIKRDKSLNALANIDLNSLSDKRQDESLYNEIFKIRYPDYTRMKSRADEMINILYKEGVEIDFPEYFERDEIGVILKINKRDGIGVLKKKIDQIDIKAIEDILELI